MSEIVRLRAELATLREQHSNVLREHEGQRQDNAAKDARIAELEALVADQKAATDEEFQNCSKLEDDNAALKARIAELENKNSYNLQIVREATARIAELEAYHTNCTDYINGLLGNMADDDKERVAILARAERAEAERDAMREALEGMCNNCDCLRDMEAPVYVQARAALAPSPAGQEG